MKVAGYGRMSTDKQQMSPEVQEKRIRDWFQAMKDSGDLPADAQFVGMFVDAAVTSRTDLLDRKAGEHILTMLGPGDMVVVAKFDRAFRSPADCERTLKVCKEAGISFRFIDANIDEQSANGQLFAGMMALAAKYERDMRSETTKDAMAYRRQTGHAQHLPTWGWKIDPRTKGERADKIKKMKKLQVDHVGRNVALACLHLIKGGMGKTAASYHIKKSLRRNKLNYPSSHETVLKAATCAALGFPKVSIKYCNRLLGRKLQNIEFVRGGEPVWQATREELRRRFEEEGISGY